MKLALLTCTANLNIGNEFINQGCQKIIEKTFPNEKLDKFESLETICYNRKAYIKPFQSELETYDIIFIACGSLISSFGIPSIKAILQLKKPKKVFMGLGMFQYDEQEKNYCKEIEKYPNTYYFVRDPETYFAFNNRNINVFLGIDCAFFLNDIQKKLTKKKKYAVINLDIIPDNINRIKEAIKDFKKNNYKYVYVVENTSTKYDYGLIKDIKNEYIFVSEWYSLYQLYQNASFVVTNRVHTTVACLTNNIPVCFEWTYPDIPKTKRLNLFKRIKILVKSGHSITKDYTNQIEKYKSDFLELFKNKMKEIVK